MASPALKAAPSPAEIDLKAAEFHALEAKWKDAKLQVTLAGEPVDKLEKELIELARNWGSSHAQKSRILHGILWEMMATFGQSLQLDTAAVERLRVGLKKADQSRLLKKLFQKDVRWIFSAASAVVIKSDKAVKLSPKIKGLLLDCFVQTNRTPTLDVRKKKAA